MMRIMFVDDEQYILDGIRRLLRGKRHEWDMTFIDSGADALAAIEERQYDVVVSDMKMPGINGAELLSKVRERMPRAVRIALSGETDTNMIYRCVQNSHQYIAKPCDVPVLVSAIDRTQELRNVIADERLRSLVAKASALPTIPEPYKRMTVELQASEPSIAKLEEIIKSDIAMTTKVLQLVNAAYFGLSREISTVSEAIMFLGIDTIKNLVLSAGLFSQFATNKRVATVAQSISSFGLTVGSLAREIALQQTGDKTIADQAMTGGFLADIGRLVLAANLPEEFQRIEKDSEESGISIWQAELNELGQSHMEVGAFLLGLWGLPDSIVECAAYHHRPADCVATGFVPMSAVHIAQAIVSDSSVPGADALDEAYVRSLGIFERADAWRAIHERRNN